MSIQGALGSSFPPSERSSAFPASFPPVPGLLAIKPDHIAPINVMKHHEGTIRRSSANTKLRTPFTTSTTTCISAEARQDCWHPTHQGGVDGWIRDTITISRTASTSSKSYDTRQWWLDGAGRGKSAQIHDHHPAQRAWTHTNPSLPTTNYPTIHSHAWGTGKYSRSKTLKGVMDIKLFIVSHRLT